MQSQIIQQGIDMFTKEIETLGQGVYILTPYFNEFNFFSYMGFGSENFFMYERALKNSEAMRFETKVDAKAITDLQFKALWELESTISEDGKSVSWYEQGIYNTRSTITTDTITSAVIVESAERFAVGQLVSTAPVGASVGTEVTAKVTAINLVTDTVTLGTAVNAKVGDQLVIIQQVQTIGAKVVGAYTGPKSDKLNSVYGKYGAEIEFEVAEVNTTRFFASPRTYVDNKIKLNAIKIYNEMANSWFKGTNVAGNEPIAEGIQHVIDQRDANGLPSKKLLTTALYTDEQGKLEAFQDLLDLCAQAPVYMNDEPIVICNQAFATKFASSLRALDRQIDNDSHIAHFQYGLKTISSPFIGNKGVIIVKQMNHLYHGATAFILPKALVTFKQPAFTLVHDNTGAANVVPHAPGKIIIVKQPTVTADRISSTMEYYVANLFAGQTYENTYYRVDWK